MLGFELYSIHQPTVPVPTCRCLPSSLSFSCTCSVVSGDREDQDFPPRLPAVRIDSDPRPSCTVPGTYVISGLAQIAQHLYVRVRRRTPTARNRTRQTSRKNTDEKSLTSVERRRMDLSEVEKRSLDSDVSLQEN